MGFLNSEDVLRELSKEEEEREAEKAKMNAKQRSIRKLFKMLFPRGKIEK